LQAEELPGFIDTWYRKMIRAIAHPTDFSAKGRSAFAHALSLALASRCPLDLLHVHGPHSQDHYERFPHVREVLVRWGMLGPHATIEDIEATTGVRVRKVEIRDAHAADGLSQFLLSHHPDLLVMATHGREGLNRWVRGSVSRELAHKLAAPVLFVGPNARPFVDWNTGEMRLHDILVPIDHEPVPLRALHSLKHLMKGMNARIDIVHVGEEVPNLMDENGGTLHVRRLQGAVVERILEEAGTRHASLIAMPTAGHHAFLDAFRGRTTDQVIARAPCPVLTLPT